MCRRESATRSGRRYRDPPWHRAAPRRSSVVRDSAARPWEARATAPWGAAFAARTDRRAHSSGPRHRAGDDDLLNLARALVDPECPDLAVETLDDRALAHAARAEKLNRIVDDALCALG